MKKFAMALLVAGIVGAAWAEDAAPAPSCAQPCVRKVCCPEPTMVKTTKIVYEEKCIDFCLPKCPSLFGGCGTCCEKPRTKKVLVKKVITCECPDTKCELRLVADQPCATSCPAAPCAGKEPELIAVPPKGQPKPLPK